jgi:hypothetical protein
MHQGPEITARAKTLAECLAGDYCQFVPRMGASTPEEAWPRQRIKSCYWHRHLLHMAVGGGDFAGEAKIAIKRAAAGHH